MSPNSALPVLPQENCCTHIYKSKSWTLNLAIAYSTDSICFYLGACLKVFENMFMFAMKKCKLHFFEKLLERQYR